MSADKDEHKQKTVLFHISHSLFKNKRLKRRLNGETRKKSPKKRPKPKRRQEVNGRPTLPHLPPPSETIEISTDEEGEPSKCSEVETSIVLSSDGEDEETAQARIFPMLASETTVRTAVGNKVYELSLEQLKENLETITKTKKTKRAPANKRLSSAASVSADVSISLLSDDEEDNNTGRPPTATHKLL